MTETQREEGMYEPTPGERQLERSHPHQADPITPPNLVRKGPGRLQGGGALELHTNLGHLLFFGRRQSKDPNGKHPIVGLTRFADSVKRIWDASANDDPYADAVLIEMDQAFDKAEICIDGFQKELDELMESVEQINYELYTSIDPVKIDMQFRAPWGYVGARLLVKFDQVIRTALSARNYALLSDEEYHRIRQKSGSKIRHLFALSQRWTNTSVRRDDIAAGNRIAQRAATKYAERRVLIQEVPEDVMRGDRRPKLCPPIRGKDDTGLNATSAAGNVVDDSGDAFGDELDGDAVTSGDAEAVSD